MQTMNFQPLNFSTIEGYDRRYDDARRRKIQSGSNMFDAVGQGASDVFRTYGEWQDRQDELQRQEQQQKLANDWRRKQWDYQTGRDKIMDERYRQQQEQQEAIRLDNMRRAQELRKGFMEKYGTVDLEKYGPQAGFAMERIRNARDWNDVVAGGESLANIINYRDMLDAQRAEQQQANLGPNESNRINAELALMGIDTRDPESSVYRMRDRDFYKDEDTRYQINRRIQRLDDLIRMGYGNQQMYDQRAALERASEALRRRMYRTDQAGRSMVDRYGRYTKQQDF